MDNRVSERKVGNLSGQRHKPPVLDLCKFFYKCARELKSAIKVVSCPCANFIAPSERSYELEMGLNPSVLLGLLRRPLSVMGIVQLQFAYASQQGPRQLVEK